MSDKPYAMSWSEATPVEMLPGLTRRTLAQTETAMVVEFRSLADVTIPEHDHPHEQVGYVVSGQIDLTFAGQTHSLKPGDSYAIPGGIPHGATFPVESIVIDCFSPPREDYQVTE